MSQVPAPSLPRHGWPATRREPVVDVIHRARITDPYRWLEDGNSPEVLAWMDQQDQWARSVLDGMPGRDALATRLRELFYADAVSPPERRANRYFSRRSSVKAEKSFLVLREAGAPERVLLDPNTWPKDTALGGWSPSWDGKKLAFSRRPNAADEAVLYVLDVDSGEESAVDVITGARYATAHWTPDNLGFYYEWIPMDPAIPDDQRPGRIEIRYHRLGDDPAQDRVVRPSLGDPGIFQMASLSYDGRFLFITWSYGWNSNDVWVVDRAQGDHLPPRPLVVGRPHHYQVSEHAGYFYLHTDEGAPKSRVLRAPVEAPPASIGDWQEVVPEDPSATLEGWSIVGGHLSLAYLREAASELRICALDGSGVRVVRLPMLGAASLADGLPDDDEAWFAFSSFTVPQQIYRLSIQTGETSLFAEIVLPLDPTPYVVRQEHAVSADGTRVPMFLIHRRDLSLTGDNPTVLYGYGGFRVSLGPTFRASLFPWLDAGGVYVVANLRGGGELGAAWHEAGKGEHKQNVFDDFIAVAEHLVARRYTRPARLGIWGGSNGGLLVGAAMTQRPDLFGAVVCAVPLLDMLRFHLSGAGRTWVSEYGSADSAADLPYLLTWSPYHHVSPATRYPPLLMLSADHDDRVDPMHARKFVAAVQHAVDTADGVTGGPALLRIERSAGHGGADQVAERVASSADTWAFLMETLGCGR